MAYTLPFVDIWGNSGAGGNTFDPYGEEWIWRRDHWLDEAPEEIQNAQQGGGGGGEPPPPEPPPDKLEPVDVTAPPPKPPEPAPAFVAPPVAMPPQYTVPVASASSGLLAGILEVAAPVVALLMPTPTAPRSMDEAPDVLPEVKVSGRAPPKPPANAMPFDFLLPPNWNDLLDWSQPRDWLGFTAPDTRRRDGTAPDSKRPNDGTSGPPRVDTATPELAPVDVVARRPRPAPGGAAAPDLLGSPFELPFGFPVELPSLEPSFAPEPAPRSSPAPRLKPITLLSPYDFTLPLPGTSADPYVDPTLEPFAPLRPDEPLRTTPRVPSIDASPSPLLPIGSLDPLPLDPIVATLPSPRIPQRVPTDSNTCTCADKKPRKERKPRERCFAGTYRETRTSTKKDPSQWVDCETGEPIGSQER